MPAAHSARHLAPRARLPGVARRVRLELRAELASRWRDSELARRERAELERLDPVQRARLWRAVALVRRTRRRARIALADAFHVAAWHARSTLAPASESRFAPGRADLPVVVPVPGIYERWDFLIPVLDVLNAHGHPVHVSPNLGRMTAPARVLAQRLLRELRQRGLRDVVLVTHSKGGLVGKLALLDPRDGRDAIAGVIAIATPFRGTRIVERFRRSARLMELARTSAGTVYLAERPDVDDRIVSIYATHDALVTEASRLDRGTNVLVRMRGHTRMLADPVVHVAVLRAVRGLRGIRRRETGVAPKPAGAPAPAAGGPVPV